MSPILLIVVVFETSVRNAYPSEGDTIFIPLASYLLLLFVFLMIATLEIDTNGQQGDLVLFWNPKRNLKSLATLLASGVLFWFWLIFLAISINVVAFGSAIICTLMLIVIPIARTMAIQNQAPTPNPLNEDLHLQDVSTRTESLNERFENLKANLERLKSDRA